MDFPIFANPKSERSYSYTNYAYKKQVNTITPMFLVKQNSSFLYVCFLEETVYKTYECSKQVYYVIHLFQIKSNRVTLSTKIVKNLHEASE